MLHAFNSLPSQADIYTFVCSRDLGENEERLFLEIIENWLREVSRYSPECEVSHAKILNDKCVYGFAIYNPNEKYKNLTGGDLDPLYEAIRVFEKQVSFPIEIFIGEAFLINMKGTKTSLIRNASPMNISIGKLTCFSKTLIAS